ncbi:MAG TPA: protein kinase [Thermohalobaculum sp.]|nr:protein kinase [Thermohalobaculum sp.]
MARRAGDIFQPGHVLSHTYEIEVKLGGGGVGQVYRARNLVSDSLVAIKVLNEEFSRNADYMELIKREERIREISHDAVVHYYVVSRTEDGLIYLVVEYVEGPSLDLWMQRRGVKPEDLLLIARRIAEGLSAIHARGLVHRDLSPDNVILRNGRPDQAVIIDFGIVKDTRRGAQTVIGGDFAGKYEYAAPEQFEGNADARSDLYALGATLLAAYRGEAPRMPAAPGQIIRQKAKPIDTDGVPQPLRGLIDRLADPDPSRRPESADAVLEWLEAPQAGGGRRLGRVAVPTLLAAAAAVAAFALWDRLERWVGPTAPVASPYLLVAEGGADGGGAAHGHAPDEAAQRRLAAYLLEEARVPEDAIRIELAGGAPSETWTDEVIALLDATAPLEEWRLEVVDRTATLNGLAADPVSRDRAAEAFRAAAEAGYEPTMTLEVGPRALDPEVVRAALDQIGNCGPLQLVSPPASYPPGAEIAVAGTVAGTEDRAALEARLGEIAGDRPLRLDLKVLNQAVCRISDLLPENVRGDISFWFGDGDTGEANFSGVYEVGSNPVVDVLIPASIEDGFLYVVAVDVDGEVFHLLPRLGHPENRISEIGEVAQGVRRIRVAHPRAEREADPNKIAFEVNEDFGQTMFVALLSPRPLFEGLRPGGESVEGFALALSENQSSPETAVQSFASRLLETR